MHPLAAPSSARRATSRRTEASEAPVARHDVGDARSVAPRADRPDDLPRSRLAHGASSFPQFTSRARFTCQRDSRNIDQFRPNSLTCSAISRKQRLTRIDHLQLLIVENRAGIERNDRWAGDHDRFDAPLPDLWDDDHAASLDEPGLLLYRSNLLGSDLRITNFGGGNTSAKLDRRRSADRRADGSPLGQRLGRRHRLDEARRFLDPLPRQASRPPLGLSRPRTRGRDGRAVQSLHVQPQSARDLDRYAAARLRAASACRSRSRRRGHRDRRERERRSADAARFMAASSAFCRGSGPGSTSA